MFNMSTNKSIFLTASRVFTDLLLNFPKRSPGFSPGYEDIENMFCFLNTVFTCGI